MQTSLARVLLVALALALAGLSAWSLRYFKRYQPLAGLMPGPGALDQSGLQVTDAVVTGRVGGTPPLARRRPADHVQPRPAAGVRGRHPAWNAV